MKLAVGDKIRVIGYPMLAKLGDGMIFKVYDITKHYGQDVYWLQRGRTKVGHYVSSVDRSIRGGSDLNRLEIVK